MLYASLNFSFTKTKSINWLMFLKFQNFPLMEVRVSEFLCFCEELYLQFHVCILYSAVQGTFKIIFLIIMFTYYIYLMKLDLHQINMNILHTIFKKRAPLDFCWGFIGGTAKYLFLHWS